MTDPDGDGLRSAFALLPAAVVLFDARGSVRLATHEACALLCPEGEDGSPSEALEWLAGRVVELASGEETEAVAERWCERDGDLMRLQVRLRRVPADEGGPRVAAALSLRADPGSSPPGRAWPWHGGESGACAGGRVRARDLLRDSEDRYRTLLASLPQRIFFKDVEGRFVTVNELFAGDFGLAPADLQGRSDHDLFPSDLAEKYRADDRRIMEKGETETIVETNIVGGQKRYVEVVKSPIVAEDGEVLGVLGVFTDITERWRAEEELKHTAEELARSNEDLQQFAYVASHDLQEPLRMVASYTQLLARRYRDRLDQDAHEFISYAVDGATRMQTLIDDLLAYSRVGTRAQEPENADSENCLRRALANLVSSIQHAGADVTHDPLPRVRVDAGQLVQVFQNLVGNAVKFHGDRTPRVHVSAERQGEDWVFAVRDNGIGIDPAYMERIFLIFQRLHSRGEYPGSGLGLAICKKIVSRHGGRIWVDSRPGEGATFFFSLPASDEAPADGERDGS